MTYYEVPNPEGWGFVPPLQEGHEITMGRPYWDASWPWPLSAVEDFFKGLWNFLLDLPWRIISSVWGFFQNLWNGIAGAFSGIWSSISATFSNLWQTLAASFNGLWIGIKSVFANLWNGIAGGFSGIWTSISATFSNLWQTLAAAFNGLWIGIKSVVANLWNGIASFFQDLWRGIVTAFNNFGSWISNAFNDLWRALRQGLQSLGEATIASLNAFGAWLNEAVVAPIGALPANLLGGIVDFVSDFLEKISSFVLNLFRPIANFFVKDVLAGLLKVFEPFAEFFAETMDSFFDTLTGQVGQGGTMTPESAYNVVPSMISILGLMLLGFTGMTVAGELLHPLKTIGLGHVSAALYDVTSYKLISGAFVGALTYAMIRQPLGYYFNQWFHPSMPDERMVRELMSRRAFTRPEDLRNPDLIRSVKSFAGIAPAALEQLFLGYHGYHAGYFGMFKEMANTPLRYFPLAGIARTGFYDFTWFQEALARSGYSQTAVDQLHMMYQAMVLDEARGRHSSTVVKRYKEGLIDDSEFDLEMATLRYSPEQIASERVHAQLEYQTDFTMDLLDGYRYSFRKGKIDEAEFRRGLASLGMEEERIEGWLFREGVRRKGED